MTSLTGDFGLSSSFISKNHLYCHTFQLQLEVFQYLVLVGQHRARRTRRPLGSGRAWRTRQAMLEKLRGVTPVTCREELRKEEMYHTLVKEFLQGCSRPMIFYFLQGTYLLRSTKTPFSGFSKILFYKQQHIHPSHFGSLHFCKIFAIHVQKSQSQNLTFEILLFCLGFLFPPLFELSLKAIQVL